MGANSGLLSFTEYQSREEDRKRKERDTEDVDEDQSPLTEEERGRLDVIRFCDRQYDAARKGREQFETFDVCWDLFIGNTWPTRFPTWRARITINKIRAFITFMQAIMTDNKPRISVEPLIEGTEDAADLIRKIVDRTWDEEDLQGKLSTFVLYGLIWGTGVMKITHDPYANGGRGKKIIKPVVPYRFYTNPLATCIEDAEHIIHVEDMTMGWVRRNFPEKASALWKLRGVHSTGDRRERDRDFIREGDANETQRIISAQNVNGNVTGPQYSAPNPAYMDYDSDEVEVREHWMKDERLEKYERHKIVNGQIQYEPVLDDEGLYDMEKVGDRVAISEIDGQPFLAPILKPKMQPVMETAWRLKYPNGRLCLIAGGRVLLRDIPAPFQIDDCFPFAIWKDYDVGTIWGQGEPLALKDCSVAIQRIISQLYDILEKTGNPSWKLKKGAGVNARVIKNRPGAVISMDEMDALAPLERPPVPKEFLELYEALRKAMGEICGVNDSVMGQLPAANTAFATMDQLQESGAAPIRLKVRNFESGITRIGKILVQLIQQYDHGERPLRIAKGEREPGVVDSLGSIEPSWKTYTNADLQGPVAFGIVPISSMGTSPAGTWNRWMDLYSKHIVDRTWFITKFRLEGWRTELPRMELQDKQAAEAAAAAKQKSGPPGKSSNAQRRKKPQAPGSHHPTRQDNAAVR